MGNLPNAPRTAHGFAALKKRYVRRAAFLTKNQEFRDAIATVRSDWNRRFPRYLAVNAHMVSDSGLPAVLERDYKAKNKEFKRWKDSWNETYPVTSWKEAYESNGVEHDQRRHYVEFVAYETWQKMVWEIVDVFFPLEDFPYPFSGAVHPASAFVAGCLGTDPRLVDECESFFASFELTPVSLDSYDPHAEFMDVASDEDWSWYLPLYPGITVDDLKRAAPEIVGRVNNLYATRTTGARIATLYADGLTHKMIAERLGLTEQTVASALSQTPPVTTENG